MKLNLTSINNDSIKNIANVILAFERGQKIDPIELQEIKRDTINFIKSLEA